MEEITFINRGLGNSTKETESNKLKTAEKYFTKLTNNFLQDPAKYLQNLPGRNRAAAVKVLEARLDRLVATKARKDTEPYNPLDPTLTESSKAAQIAGLGHMIAQLHSKDVENAMNSDYQRDFIAWLLGKGKEEHHRKTPWYRSPWAVYTLPDVRDFISGMIDVVFETQAELTWLIVGPKTTLKEMEAYFKYVVDMSWMRDDSFFFVDIVEFLHGGMKGGGLTQTELDRMNVRQAKRQYNTHGDEKSFKYNERNTKATTDDVFSIPKEDMAIYRGTEDEELKPGYTLITDMNRGIKVNVEGQLQKLNAMYQNANATRENVGRSTYRDHRGQSVDAGFFTKNFQPPPNDQYGQSFAGPMLVSDEQLEEDITPRVAEPEPEKQVDPYVVVFNDEEVKKLEKILQRSLSTFINAQESSFEGKEVESLGNELSKLLS